MVLCRKFDCRLIWGTQHLIVNYPRGLPCWRKSLLACLKGKLVCRHHMFLFPSSPTPELRMDGPIKHLCMLFMSEIGNSVHTSVRSQANYTKIGKFPFKSHNIIKALIISFSSFLFSSIQSTRTQRFLKTI